MTAIKGNTYPVKDQLKSLGAKWNPDAKAWMIDDEKAEEAKSIVASACAANTVGAANTASAKPQYRPSRCKECGARTGPRGWPKIYRNGICSDCYRDRDDEF